MGSLMEMGEEVGLLIVEVVIRFCSIMSAVLWSIHASISRILCPFKYMSIVYIMKIYKKIYIFVIVSI